jgi:hypothetical protein
MKGRKMKKIFLVLILFSLIGCARTPEYLTSVVVRRPKASEPTYLETGDYYFVSWPDNAYVTKEGKLHIELPSRTTWEPTLKVGDTVVIRIKGIKQYRYRTIFTPIIDYLTYSYDSDVELGYDKYVKDDLPK